MNRNDELQHFGVKGMRWGVRNSTRASQGRYKSYGKGLKLIDKSRLKKMSSAKEREAYLNAKDKKWIEKASNDSNVRKVATRTASQMKRVNKQLQKEHGGSGITGAYKRTVSAKMNREYQKALKEAYDEVLLDNAYSVFKISPSRTREVEITALADGRLKATVVQRNNLKLTKQRAQINKAVERRERKEAKLAKRNLQQSEFDTDPFSKLDGMSFIITTDENGYADDVTAPFDDILQNNYQDGNDMSNHIRHYGVKGMKWGVRNNNNESSSQDAAGGGGGGEEEEGFLDEMEDMFGDIKDSTLKSLDDAKKLGKSIFDSIKDRIGAADSFIREGRRAGEQIKIIKSKLNDWRNMTPEEFESRPIKSSYKRKDIPLTKWEKEKSEKYSPQYKRKKNYDVVTPNKKTR